VDELQSTSKASQQTPVFKFDVPISLCSHTTTRKLRLRITLALTRAISCMLVASVLAIAAQCLYGVPNEQPLSQFEQALHGDVKRDLTNKSVRHLEHAVKELVASGQKLRLQGDIDVVISGGGFRGQYAGGVIGVLVLLQEQGFLRIQRWSGTSVGALTAASFASGAPFEEFIRIPYAWAAVWQPKRFWESHRIIREKLHVVMPSDDEHKKANGKVYVHMTQFTPWPQSRVVSNFSSRQMYFDALAASSTVPGFSGNPLLSRFEGVISGDGGFTMNLPIFRDGLRTQLVINLGFIQLGALYTFAPLDPNPEVLVLQGIDDVIKLLKGGDVRPLEVLSSDELEAQGRYWPFYHYLLLYDIAIWGLYGFGPQVLCAILLGTAVLVTILEFCQTEVLSTKKFE